MLSLLIVRGFTDPAPFLAPESRKTEEHCGYEEDSGDDECEDALDEMRLDDDLVDSQGCRH